MVFGLEALVAIEESVIDRQPLSLNFNMDTQTRPPPRCARIKVKTRWPRAFATAYINFSVSLYCVTENLCWFFSDNDVPLQN